MTLFRNDGRAENQLRPIHIQYDLFGHAHASVLFELGGTKVLVSVTLQPNVPPFLKGQRVGWLAAEYSMLPCATHQRTQRDSSQVQKNPRGVEISRLIGRSLRSVLDLEKLGERTIWVDCDVLQADGGTRTACITAAYIALRRAVQQWLSQGLLKHSILTEELAAISVGIRDNEVLLDVDYQEDSSVDADFNFVLTRSGSVIEIQGTAEKKPVSWELFERARVVAQQGVETLCSSLYDETPGSEGLRSKELLSDEIAGDHGPDFTGASRDTSFKETKAPLFSLQNRQQSSSSQ